jgi:hypothetical protein
VTTRTEPEPLGTIVADEVIFRIVRVRLSGGMVLLDAETERGDTDFGGGLTDCTVFGADGREVLSLPVHIARLHTRDGQAHMTLPVHINEVVASSP